MERFRHAHPSPSPNRISLSLGENIFIVADRPRTPGWHKRADPSKSISREQPPKYGTNSVAA